MSEQEEKVTPRRKVLIFAVLSLLLVVFPAMSWVYLKYGFNWRKQALSELRDYGKIRPAYNVLPNGVQINELESKVCVLYLFGENPDLTPVNKQVMDIGERLFNQFGKDQDGIVRQDFRFVTIANGGTAEFKSYFQKLPSTEYVTWTATGGTGTWGTILINGYEKFCLEENGDMTVPAFALADTSGIIRRFYPVMDEKQVGRMVEHIAMLLPK